jgi:predicted esterase
LLKFFDMPLSYKIFYPKPNLLSADRRRMLVVLGGLDSSLENLQGLEGYISEQHCTVAIDAPIRGAPAKGTGARWWDIPEWGVPTEVIARQSQESIQSLNNTLEALIRTGIVESGKVDAIGFSQGAAALAAVVKEAPEIFRRVVLISGFERTFVAHHCPALGPKNTRTAVLMLHGRRDNIIPTTRAAQLATSLRTSGLSVQFEEVDGDHWIVPCVQERAQNFLEAA